MKRSPYWGPDILLGAVLSAVKYGYQIDRLQSQTVRV